MNLKEYIIEKTFELGHELNEHQHTINALEQTVIEKRNYLWGVNLSYSVRERNNIFDQLINVLKPLLRSYDIDIYDLIGHEYEF